MYEAFYQLTQRPFSITPDPRFVYLSPRHQDALAHLLYGFGTGGQGGFVQLTGEVGTGKTTLCRLALEQAPEKTRIALILNPMLGPRELLEAICDELEVDYTAEAGQGILKIHGALNRYLLQAHADGERVVLIIDEAQNLSRDALEQVRLLTNLETATDKLLQIILIGQPELREVLKKRHLRQLAQRITARYHLDPLTADETHQYIRHRLSVAGAEHCPFQDDAINAIHDHADGVPRLINIIADRALLAGYSTDASHIDAGLVHQAAQEVAGEGAMSGSSPLRGALAVGAVVLLMVFGLGLAGLIARTQGTDPDQPQPMWQQAVLSSPAVAAWQELAAVWRTLDAAGIEAACENPTGAVRADTACLLVDGHWGDIRRLNMPVVLQLVGAPEAHVVLVGLDDTQATIQHRGQQYAVALNRLARLWTGRFAVVWPDSDERLSLGSTDPVISDYKALAAEQDDRPWRGNQAPEFDAPFDDWVRAFQRRRGINSDGIIGSVTRLYLGHPQIEAKAPKLMQTESTDRG